MPVKFIASYDKIDPQSNVTGKTNSIHTSIFIIMDDTCLIWKRMLNNTN